MRPITDFKDKLESNLYNVINADFIRKAIAMKSILLEAEDRKYEYGCLMLGSSSPIKWWNTLMNSIDKRDLYTKEEGFGLETEPHITVLFGFHDEVSPEDLKQIIDSKELPVDVSLTGVSKFEANDYEVIKLDVDSDKLHQLNAACRVFPHTSSYPTYVPHMTIAYVNKGKADKYCKKFSKPINVRLDHFVYSHPSGNKTTL